MAAERAAWRVKGVKGIAQKIEVRLPGDKKWKDDEIAQRALSILSWNTLVPKDCIRVRVADGWITLSGGVNWNYQRQAAENEVRKLGGVKGVTNNITLTSAVQAGDLKRRIQAALKRHAEVEADAVRVDVRSDGTVRIEGRVDNWSEMKAVEHAVWSAPGVQRVDDYLTFS
jgi:osmotically-inducible protein OsmY